MCATSIATMPGFPQRIFPKRACDGLGPVLLQKPNGLPSSESGLISQNGIGTTSGSLLREAGQYARPEWSCEEMLGADQGRNSFRGVDISMVPMALKRILRWRMS